jgi:hypothetical protein
MTRIAQVYTDFLESILNLKMSQTYHGEATKQSQRNAQIALPFSIGTVLPLCEISLL